MRKGRCVAREAPGRAHGSVWVSDTPTPTGAALAARKSSLTCSNDARTSRVFLDRSGPGGYRGKPITLVRLATHPRSTRVSMVHSRAFSTL